MFGSAVPALLWGVAFANIVRGVPLVELNGNVEYDGGFFNLLNPFALLGGLMLLAQMAGSWSLSNLGPRIIQNNFDPGFFVEHFIKMVRDKEDCVAIVAQAAQLGKKLGDLLWR